MYLTCTDTTRNIFQYNDKQVQREKNELKKLYIITNNNPIQKSLFNEMNQ